VAAGSLTRDDLPGAPRRRPGGRLGPASRAAGPIVAASAAILIAAPWLDQRLVWSGWLGTAVALLMIDRIRGWWAECLVMAGAVMAIAIAFHWTPAALATAMAADDTIGLAIATPIAAWDALRLALPLLIAARLRGRPEAAWLPAALVAVVAEATLPAVFPWKLGYSQVGWPVVVQSVDLLGPEWSTFVAFAHAGLLAWLIRAAATALPRQPRDRSPLRIPGAVVAAAVLCMANTVYGVAAIAAWTHIAAVAPTASLTVVQGDPNAPDGLEALRELTERACANRAAPTLVCWPECSGGTYAESLTSLADADHVLANSRPPQAGLRPWERPRHPHLFGGKIYRGHPEKPLAIHQAALLVDPALAIRGTYHKRHLMPFGEYVPAAAWLPDLARRFAMQDVLTPGTDATVLALGDARIGVLLCYEDMLPEAARSLVDNSATVLVSLINGAAFPSDVTLAQHRMLAQLRAIENRRALVRCAATGETCIVSPVGTLAARLPLHVPAVLQADVPLLDAWTPARRLAVVWPAACAAALAIRLIPRTRRTP
jgi:apolipoprotein N-acyltransferase